MSIADASGENGIDKLRNKVTAVEENVEKNTDGITRLDAFAGAVYPNKFRLKQDSGSEASNGVTVTFDNGRINVNGTATAASYIKIGSVLPDVSEWLRFSGIPEGASASTYGIRWVSSKTTADHYEDWTITSPTAGSSYDIYLKFATGCVFDNLELELMAAHDYDGDFLAYGEGLILTSCAEMVEAATDSVDAITGYTKPNLFNNTIYSRTDNGITYTLNPDKSVTMVGTATALSVPNAKCTLQPGTYILSGCADGGTETHHIMLIRAGGTAIYQYGGIERTFTVSDNPEEVTLYLRVVGGVTVDTTVYPMIRPASVYNPTYAPYGEYQIYKPIQQLIDYTSFNWSGKKMNVIGDSIVYGSYGNFVNVIRDILCLSVARNYGVGGSCLASSEQDSQYTPAVLRYENMDTDAQIIIVHAGTNDYSAQIPLGAEDSTDITTFNGALNVMMTGLREMYPTALIIFDSILHRYNDGALPIKAREYRACIESRCAANHILFYDCFKYSGFDFGKGYYDHILTGDGLHPNQIGANILGRKLAGFIRWN
jgi:lysophospholipase L1-like esterase